MKSKTIFNFFNDTDTVIALYKHFQLTKRDIEKYIVQNYKSYKSCSKKFCLDFTKDFGIPINTKPVEDVYITAKHITTFNDNGLSLQKNGLLNLNLALKKDTPLSKFLVTNNIIFDIAQQRITINNKILDLASETNNKRNSPTKYSQAIDKIYNKLYYDKCETEVFLCGKDEEITNYPTLIIYYPEILLSIDELLVTINEPMNLAEQWKRMQGEKYYILEFDVNINSFEYINSKPSSFYDYDGFFELFGYTETSFYNNSVPKIFYSNIFLLENTFDIIFDGSGKKFGQILPETIIPYQDIRTTENCL